MDKKRQEKIYELLKRGLKLAETGEELPVEWARDFFPPERREYELVYNGKETEEQILADTMAVPFQEVSTFGPNGVDWHNKLIFGDNLQAMKMLLQMKADGKLVNADGTSGVRLIYIDPPFSTKRDFSGSQDQKAYQDKIAGAEFLEFLRKRFVLLRELLANDGSIYIHLDQRKGHYAKVLLDEIFGENFFTNEIIWKRTFSHGDTGQGAQHLGRLHDIILFYKKSNETIVKATYTPYSEKYLSDFYKYVDKDGRRYRLVTMTGPGGAAKGNPRYEVMGVTRYWMYSEKRMQELIKNGEVVQTKPGTVPQRKKYLDTAKGVPLQDIWTDIAPVQGVALERFGYPTQKPEALMERIIQTSSNEGDIVLDAFAGSGTTCAVAEKLKRRWIAIDVGKLSIYTTQKRMLTLKKKIGNTGEQLVAKPFTLYNAGLYDFENLRKLPWKDWRFFALQLFECKDEPHKIHGFQMDGKRQGSSVHVFNHFDKGTVSRETIADLHASIGRTVGDRCFIIAPRGAFLFQEDYIEMDGVRYYALRIPYSFINELHRREFSALVQPNDEMAINETVEAVGFDFIQPPVVELDVTTKKQVVSVKIKKFESKARLRGEDKVSKHDALSMVMVDYDYNGKVFDLDKAFYANSIKDNKWKIELPAKEIKGDVMLVFLDIYGNEARIVIAPKVSNIKAKK